MAVSKMSVISVCFVNTELDICIGVHVDDMLAVGPSELTKNLLRELSKDMTMRWGYGD